MKLYYISPLNCNSIGQEYKIFLNFFDINKFFGELGQAKKEIFNESKDE